MPTKDYGQTYYPLSSASVAPADDMEQLAESLEGRTVVSFTSTSSRNSAATSLTTAQKKGVIAHVQGSGWFGTEDGTTWQQISTSPVKGGRFDGVAEGNNMFRIPSAQCFFSGAAPTSIVCLSATGGYDCEFGAFDGAGALIKLFNRTTGAQLTSGNAGAFYWLAMK